MRENYDMVIRNVKFDSLVEFKQALKERDLDPIVMYEGTCRGTVSIDCGYDFKSREEVLKVAAEFLHI